MPRIALRPWMLVTVLCLLYSLAVVAVKSDPLALVTIGTRFSDGDPSSNAGTEGYDGQFVYYIARDPSDAARFLDIPAYRFQRILLPALARLVSLGQTSLIPWVLLAVNLAALAAGTDVLERLLSAHRISRWYALGYALTLGAWGAARLSLPEPLAYALALGGILFAQRDHIIGAALCFALAALAKETTLILAAGVGLHLLAQRHWRDGLVFGMIVGVPFAAWQGILIAHFGAPGIGAGGALATPFEVIPFMGVIRILTEGSPAVFVTLGVILLLFVLIPTVWALVRVWRDARAGTMTLTSWLLLAAALVMLFVPFSTYREIFGILRFIVGLQIAVILYAAERKQRRVLMNSTLWVLTLIFLVGSDFAAG